MIDGVGLADPECAETVVGFCGLLFDPVPAAFHPALPIAAPAWGLEAFQSWQGSHLQAQLAVRALGPAELHLVLAGLGLVAQHPALDSCPPVEGPAAAFDLIHVVLAEPQSFFAAAADLPSVACKAAWLDPATEAAQGLAHAVHAEDHAVPDAPAEHFDPGPPMLAGNQQILDVFLRVPPQYALWGLGVQPLLCPGVLGLHPKGPLAAAAY